MIKKQDFETYLSISSSGYEINLYDIKNSKSLYKQNYEFLNIDKSFDIKFLNNFLDENIFKIEKLIGKFIKNIYLIIDIDEINTTYIGIKKKLYKERFNAGDFEHILVEVKDIYKKNYQNEKIMHMLLSRLLIDNKEYFSLNEIKIRDQICVEVEFKSISNKLIIELDEVFKKYQIKIIEYLDGNYIKKFTKNLNTDFYKLVYQIKNGLNEKEVKIITKKLGKVGIFEKFFQFFG